MGSSVPSGCEYDGGACGCAAGAAGAASCYGYGGAATGGDTGADVRACASRDDGSADDFSTAIRRFGASATGYQKYDAGGSAASDAAAGAERFSAATM